MQQAEGGVCEHPVHHLPQFRQERDCSVNCESQPRDGGVLAGENVTEHSCWVASNHLQCREDKVQALEEVDELCSSVLGEWPVD